MRSANSACKHQHAGQRRSAGSQHGENAEAYSNRMLKELIENGIEAEKCKRQESFELAELFRNASDPKEAKSLGNNLGRMVFSD